MKFYFFFGVISIFFCACHAPVPNNSCNVLPVSVGIPEPEIGSVFVNGRQKNAADLLVNAFEEDLLITLMPMPVDSYVFRLNAPGLDSCDIKTPFPQARFTFLPGGTYTLEYWVQKGSETSVHKTFSFRVKKALTERWWFYPSMAVYIVLIISVLVYFWTLYNIRQKLKLQHIRSRIAADLHDEVSSDLSSIGISMTTLGRRHGALSPGLTEALQEIKQTLEDTKGNLSDTVWAIKPEKDNGKELFERMEKFACGMFASGNTRLVFKNTMPADKAFKVSMEQRFNALMIFKEAIHNIYKHAAATQTEVTIQPHPEGVLIEIRDNGSGFDPAAECDGNGVNNYFRRAKESFIDFSLDSAPGKGTFIRMILPEL